MTDDPQLYRLQVQIDSLREAVARQGRSIDALIASLPQMSQQTPGTPSRSNAAGKTYREWVGWLELNEPAYRQTIMDAVGKPLPGNQPVVDWTSIMATWADNAVPSDTLCKINGQSTGQGRPPVIYFLWSQRFEIHDKFGVGPSERPEPQTLLGVVHPPTTTHTIEHNLENQTVHVTVPEPATEPLTGEKSNPEVEVESSRFNSMDEWHERWDPLFDTLAANDVPATAEEREEMLATMPEDTGGEPHGTVLARAFHEAKQRDKEVN